MKKIALVTVMTLLLVFSLTACGIIGDLIGGGGPVVSPTPGEWSERVFTSEYMGFRFVLSPLWDAPTDNQWAILVEAGATTLAAADVELPEQHPTLYMAAINNISGANVQITYFRYGRRTPSLDEFIDEVEEGLSEAGMRVVGTRNNMRLGDYDWTYISTEFTLEDIVSRSRQFYNIYSGYIRLVTITSVTGAEELSEIIPKFIGLEDSLPESMAIEFNEILIDTWVWEEDLDNYHTYVFNADGSGSRGLIDMYNDFQRISAGEYFFWRTSGDTLLIETDWGVEGWSFTVDEDILIIESLQVPELSKAFLQMQSLLDWIQEMEEFNDNWLAEFEAPDLPDDVTIYMGMVGVWAEYDVDGVYLQFEEDGYGLSGHYTDLIPFSWGILEDNHLVKSFWWGLEDWIFTFFEETLFLEHYEFPAFIRMFIRVY